MEPIAFIAASAEEAVAQIRARLGPEAVVLNVRPLPAHGLARVVAKADDRSAGLPAGNGARRRRRLSEALAEFRQRLDQIEQHVKSPPEKARPPRSLCRNSPLPFLNWTRAAGASAGCCKGPACCRFMPSVCLTRCAPSTGKAAGVAGGGNRAGARVPGGGLASCAALRRIMACMS